MTKTEKKLREKHPTFLDELTGLSKESLEARLLGLAKGRQELLQAKEADEELKRVEEELKELKGPYRDALTAIDLKMRYIGELL